MAALIMVADILALVSPAADGTAIVSDTILLW
jgi:hypothetical protein